MEELGQQNHIEAETKSILLENHLDAEHIENYHQYLPKLDEIISQEECEKRLDLRFVVCASLSKKYTRNRFHRNCCPWKLEICSLVPLLGMKQF